MMSDCRWCVHVTEFLAEHGREFGDVIGRLQHNRSYLTAHGEYTANGPNKLVDTLLTTALQEIDENR